MISQTEYRHVSFCVSSEKLLGVGKPGSVQIQTIDFGGSIPELSEYVDGWEVVSHQVVPAGGICFLTMFLRTSVDVPNDLSGID